MPLCSVGAHAVTRGFMCIQRWVWGPELTMLVKQSFSTESQFSGGVTRGFSASFSRDGVAESVGDIIDKR